MKKWTPLLTGAGLFLSLLAMFRMAEAQTQNVPIPSAACGQRADIVKHLSKEFREAQTARGLADSGGLAEVWTSEDDSTWTILLTLPNGKACLIGTGTDWQTLEYKAPAPEEKGL
jgi:hypothetical protein